MGRFNWIWRALWTLSVIVCALGAPGMVLAFNGTDDVADRVTFGQCVIDKYVLAAQGDAQMRLDGVPGRNPHAGGTVWDNFQIRNILNITEDDIEHCLGASPGDVTELKQNGADGVYETDDYIGFKFTLTADSSTLTKGDYEYKIGSGELPATTANAPTDLSATAGNEQISVAFTAPSDDGGAAITDYEYELDDDHTWLSAGTDSSPVVVSGLANGTEYSIKLRAVNSEGTGTESAALTIQAGSPASAFEENEEEILEVVTDEAMRGVRATVSSNVRMTRAARERFVLGRQQAGTDSQMVSRAATPLDITGSAELSNGRFSTQGTFFGETGNAEGGQTRLFFGDFDVQRDADGSVSAQLNAKLAWERQISTTAMYGYYLGAELGRATLEGAFAGDQDSVGASVGAYFVAEVQPNLYLDGFASLGLGSHALELDNGTLNVASDYTTTTGTVGASLTGVVEGDGFEFWPQLQLTYGQTHIGMMTFTGEAYSLVDDTLSMDAGSVSMASGAFTAEFKVPLDGRSVSDSQALFTFAPRLICERTMTADTTNDCGGGAEIGIASRSSDGLSNLSVNIRSDRVGDTTSTGLGLKFERTF
jgi:hypothetical protein